MFVITNDYIKRGKPNDPCGCPIALYMREHVDDKIEVSRGNLYSPTALNGIAKQQGITLYLLSKAIWKWIVDFDMGYPVSEISIACSGNRLFLEGEKNVF